jgi:hypothetical protein
MPWIGSCFGAKPGSGMGPGTVAKRADANTTIASSCGPSATATPSGQIICSIDIDGPQGVHGEPRGGPALARTLGYGSLHPRRQCISSSGTMQHTARPAYLCCRRLPYGPAPPLPVLTPPVVCPARGGWERDWLLACPLASVPAHSSVAHDASTQDDFKTSRPSVHREGTCFSVQAAYGLDRLQQPDQQQVLPKHLDKHSRSMHSLHSLV